MADCDTVFPSPKDNKEQKKPPSFPSLFTGFNLKAFSDNTEAVMSPTSILDSKSFSAFKNPFWSESSTPRTPEPETRHKFHSKGIGLGIVDALKEDDVSDSNICSKPVLFGSQLRIQIPLSLQQPPVLFSPVESPKTPPEFGIKTRNSQLSSFSSGLSPSPVRKSIEFETSNSSSSPRLFTGNLSATEMELSEDYTCVISHGPNPRTTHIFDNCIVESCCGVVGFPNSSKREYGFWGDRSSSYQSESFLSFCYSCKKNLGQGKDIYMYRLVSCFPFIELLLFFCLLT